MGASINKSNFFASPQICPIRGSKMKTQYNRNLRNLSTRTSTLRQMEQSKSFLQMDRSTHFTLVSTECTTPQSLVKVEGVTLLLSMATIGNEKGRKLCKSLSVRHSVYKSVYLYAYLHAFYYD